MLINGSMLMALTAALFLAGCYEPWHKIEGNNDVTTETRAVPSFNRVFNEGQFDVYIIQASYYEVILECESNLLPYIRTRVDGNNLYVETKDNLQPNYPIKVYVYTSDIEEVNLSGSGLIYTDSIYADNLDVRLSGSGDIDMLVRANDVNVEISGSGDSFMDVEADQVKGKISGSGEMEFVGFADRADFNISGSGSVHAYDQPVDDCYATISGSGSMYVSVNNLLDVNISGSGNVYYLGNPIINSTISGSGSIIHP